MNTTASPKAPLPIQNENGHDERTHRAQTEPMSVLALGNGLYEVENAEGRTYLVDLEAGRCTCPDHVFRTTRCKHIRRIAIEITIGRTPPPGQLAVECLDCASTVFVDEARSGPIYCETHSIEPGDAVLDRETGDRLTVVAVSDRRADAVHIRSAGTTVAEHPSNEGYDPDVPVVGAIYPYARVGKYGVIPETLQVYVFPRTRLQRVTTEDT